MQQKINKSNLLLDSLIVFDLSDIKFDRIVILLRFFGTLAPIVSKCICKECSVVVIVSGCHRPRSRLGALQFALVVLIPEEVAPILTVRCKGVESLVEGQTIHTVHLWLFSIFFNSMALEAEVLG